MDPWELSSKGTREVHVTTSILEVATPCDATGYGLLYDLRERAPAVS